MKYIYFAITAFALSATAAQAHIGDVEVSIQEVRTASLTVSQPLRTVSLVAEDPNSCVLPLSLAHLVEIPETFEGDDDLVLACVAE